MSARSSLLCLTVSVVAVIPAPALADAIAPRARGFATGYSSGSRDAAAFEYALIERGSMTTAAVSEDDRWSKVTDLQTQVNATGRECLWFALDDRSYIVRDQALLERAHAIVQPMNELGRRQAQLGREQGELGSQQGDLGRVQGRIGGIQGRLARLQAAHDPDLRAELDDLQRQLSSLEAQARSMGARQRELGARQRELGERQHVLGEQQRIAAETTTRELRSLAADAIASGAAERLSD